MTPDQIAASTLKAAQDAAVAAQRQVLATWATAAASTLVVIALAATSYFSDFRARRRRRRSIKVALAAAIMPLQNTYTVLSEQAVTQPDNTFDIGWLMLSVRSSRAIMDAILSRDIQDPDEMDAVRVGAQLVISFQTMAEQYFGRTASNKTAGDVLSIFAADFPFLLEFIGEDIWKRHV